MQIDIQRADSLCGQAKRLIEGAEVWTSIVAGGKARIPARNQAWADLGRKIELVEAEADTVARILSPREGQAEEPIVRPSQAHLREIRSRAMDWNAAPRVRREATLEHAACMAAVMRARDAINQTRANLTAAMEQTKLLEAKVDGLETRFPGVPTADELKMCQDRLQHFKLETMNLANRSLAVIKGLDKQCAERTKVMKRPSRPGGRKSVGQSPAAQKTPEMPAGKVDNVHFLVTSRPTVRPGEAFCVGLWALEKQRIALEERIRTMSQRGEVQIGSKGPLFVRRGTQLVAKLELEGCVLRAPVGVILWEGEIGNHDFPVRVPQDAPPGDREGAIQICIDAVPVATLYFTISVGSAAGETVDLPLQTRRFRTAFASYASEDRLEVVRRVQGIEAASVHVWLDVVNLRSGDDWAREIERQVGSTDIFYLFWSHHAAASEWVKKETMLALRRKGSDYVRPIPLETVNDVQPPQWLPDKHLNDMLLYILHAENSLRERGAKGQS